MGDGRDVKWIQETREKLIRDMNHLKIMDTDSTEVLDGLLESINHDTFDCMSEEVKVSYLERISVAMKAYLKIYPYTVDVALEHARTLANNTNYMKDLTIRALMMADPNMSREEALRRAAENPLVPLPHLR